MRKFLFLLVLLLVLPFAPVSAVDSASGPAALAKYAPGNAVMFIAARTDDAYIDAIQSVVDRVQTKLPAELNIPKIDLRAELQKSLGTGSPVTYDDLRAALGDSIGVATNTFGAVSGASMMGQEPPDTFVVAEVGDRAAMEKLITITPQIKESGTEGDFTLYDVPSGLKPATVALSDSLLIIGTNQDEVMAAVKGGGDTLDANAEFKSSMDALPEDTYNIIGYINLATMMKTSMGPGAASQPMMGGMSLDDLGSVAFGMTILDERALVIDAAQTTKLPGAMGDMGMAPISADFAKNIPADSDVVIHGNNLAGTLSALITLMDSSVDATTQAKPSAQLSSILGMTGLNLNDDILEAATGDYAIFGGIDVPALMNIAAGSADLSKLPGGFGIAIEMKDAAAAELVATKLGTFITTMGGQAQGIKIGAATVNGVKVTNISITASPQMPTTIEIMLGAKDAVLFVATSDIAQHITGGGDADLNSSPVYTDAWKYVLPDAYQVWYVNDDGLLLSTVIPLALLGPAIGNVFNNVAADLQTSMAPQKPTRQTIQFDPNDQMGQLKMAYDTFSSILHSATISASRKGDIGLTRLVLTLE